MPKWISAAQGTDEWLKSRIGNLTASRMADAMAVTRTGESEKRRKLKLDIVAERLTGRATEVFVSDAMKWGMKYESEAREAYENATGNLVQICGLAMHDTIPHLGASPDGLIDEDCIWECKCPNTSTYLSYKLAGTVPEQYKPQMLLQMICTGRSKGVFTAYDPRLPEEYRLFVAEYVPEQIEIERVKTAAQQFLVEVQQVMDKLANKGEF